MTCPLCMISFSNLTSMKLHFENNQHVERYKYAIEEFHLFANQSSNSM